MFSYYATRGVSLLEKLNELHQIYGYCMNTLHSYAFEGSSGFAKMQAIMQAFRGEAKTFGVKRVVKLLDYAEGLDGLPKSDVVKFHAGGQLLSRGASIWNGTEAENLRLR